MTTKHLGAVWLVLTVGIAFMAGFWAASGRTGTCALHAACAVVAAYSAFRRLTKREA